MATLCSERCGSHGPRRTQSLTNGVVLCARALMSGWNC